MARGPGFLRNIAQRLASPFVALAVRLGRPIGQLGRALSRIGVQIEAGALRAQMAKERATQEAAGRVIGLPRDLPIDIRDIPEAVSRQRREFAFTVRTLYIDVATGAQTSRFITVSSSALLTPAEIEMEAQEILKDGYGEIEPISFEITRMTRVGATGLL